MFYEFSIDLGCCAVASTSGGTQVAPEGGRRFLGVRIKNRKKTIVKNPKSAIPKGLKSRNLINVRRRQSTNPVVKTKRAGLV
jgi:hypothetical protein